jgi:guanylate kinase
MIIALLGESGSGKSSIEKELVKMGYNKVISYTTREPRSGEIDGVNYYFITKDKFEKLITEGFFAEYTEYNSNFYGSSMESFLQDNVVFVCEPYGLFQIMKFNELDIRSFFIKTNIYTRIERMQKRGDNDKAIYERIINDRKTFAGAEKITDYVITNDNKTLEQVTQDILNILK